MFVLVIFVLSLVVALGVMAVIGDWRSAAAWWAAAGIAFVAVIGVACSAFHTGSTNGDGISIGSIVSVGNEGFWWSNPTLHLLHRGEMNAESFALDGPLIERARHFANTGERVRVHYTSSYICGAWNYSSCDVVGSIDLDTEEKR